MTKILRLLAVLALGLVAARSFASDADLAAVAQADDERVAATIAGDRARLDAVLSDALRYGHSNGHIDTKASLIDAFASHRVVCESITYPERHFALAAPGVVLMTGRQLLHVHAGKLDLHLDLNYLGVWRNEGGHWRFLAWQSCHNPPAEPAKG